MGPRPRSLALRLAPARIALVAFALAAPGCAGLGLDGTGAVRRAAPPSPLIDAPAPTSTRVSGLERWELDLGALEVGRLEIHSRTPEGAAVRVTFGEARADLDARRDGLYPAVVEARPASHAPWRDERIRAFRYLRLESDPGTMEAIERVGWRRTSPSPPSGASAGSFRSSDPALDEMWRAGADTLRLCTEAGEGGLVLDGADRDRAVWAADLEVATRVMAATGPDLEPVRRSLLHLARVHRPADAPVASTDHAGIGALVDYGSWWSLALARYVRETGDRGTARELWPVLRAQAEHTLDRIEADGLIHKDADELEWCYTLRRAGAVTYVNVLASRGLAAAAELARELGESDAAERWDLVASDLRDTVLETAWDPDRGVLATSPGDPRLSLDANVFPLVFGWLDRDRRLAVLRAIRAHLWSAEGPLNVDGPYGDLDGPEHDGRVWPFLAFFEADARLAEPGGAPEAFELMRRTWGGMLEHDPGHTYWEWIGPDGLPETPRTSLAHAWSAGVTALLTERVLGVRAVAPRRFVVEPVPGPLASAEGRRPTPWGPLDVAWSRDAEARGFTLDLDLPPGVALERVRLPGVLADDRVTVNGAPAEWRREGVHAVLERWPADATPRRLRIEAAPRDAPSP